MPTLLHFLLRLLFLAAGIVFALSLVVVVAVLAVLWLLRAAWARLTGRPVMPFGIHAYPRDAFEQMMRRATQPQAASRTPRADTATPDRRWVRDVTDVEPK